MRRDGLVDHLAAVADDAALEVPFGDRVYRVPAPTEEVWERCVALHAAQQSEDPQERVQLELQALRGGTLADLTLTPGVAAEMAADGVPRAVVRRVAQVALMAWVLGEGSATSAVARMEDRRRGEEGGAEGKAPAQPTRAATPRRGTKQPGTGSGSARKTRTPASGPAGTGSQPV